MKFSTMLLLVTLLLMLGLNSTVFAELCMDAEVSADHEYAHIGDTILYEVSVSNCGETSLFILDVNSSLLGDLTLEFPYELPPGVTAFVLSLYEIQPGDSQILINDVNALAIDESGVLIEDSNDAVVFLVNPDINLTNTVDKPDPWYGYTVTYSICIENTGDWPLENVEVEDPLLSAIYGSPLPGFPPVLFPGEVWCQEFPYEVQEDAPCPLENCTEVISTPLDLPDLIVDEDCVEICPEPPGGEGCVPGFWKTNASNHGASAWCDRFSPDDPFSTHFSLIEPLEIQGKGKKTITNPVLLQALGANGGGVNAMIRQGVAAMLNACSDCVNYEISSPDQVISMIEDTLNGAPGAYTVNELHHMFAQWNEAGCSVNQHGDCVDIEEEIDSF